METPTVNCELSKPASSETVVFDRQSTWTRNHSGTVLARTWVRDEVTAIRAALRKQLARRGVDAVVLSGGTGVAPRDVTPDAVEPLLERALPGFGERLRALSWASVGSAAWLSRAGAGVARGRLVVYLPGSAGAVRQALEALLIPELVHVVRLLGRF